MPFLENDSSYQGRPLIDYAGGWMETMLPLAGSGDRHLPQELGLLRDVCSVSRRRDRGAQARHPALAQARGGAGRPSCGRGRIKVILAANYFDEQKIRTVAARVDAVPVIVPLYVGGAKRSAPTSTLVDCWTEHLARGSGSKTRQSVRARGG